MIIFFYFTKNSLVISKIKGKLSLYQGIASSYGYTINYSNDPALDNSDIGIENLYFDGTYVKAKPAKPNDDAYWDAATNSWAEDINFVKDKRKQYINDARLLANNGTFDHASKAFSCDQYSRSDIDVVNGTVLLTGAFPVGFTNQWKAVDNSYLAIPDIPAWSGFYGALASLGIANFNKAQTKKAAIDSATTIAVVNAITWDSVE